MDLRAGISGMVRTLAHRGPDGHGSWISEPVALGHTRLAIIDPAGGQQPMSDAGQRAHITFNGEIYNFSALRGELQALGHRFRTRSDTEVVLASWLEWGEACVERLQGMYAFAIWDSRVQRLFLARDHFGIKPLLYGAADGIFYFASEFQAIASLGLTAALDYEALDLYLQLQCIPAPFTVVKEVRKLEPGSMLVVDAEARQVRRRRYWIPRFVPEPEADARSDSDWLELLDQALEASVRRHLVSDVPFGAFLSGGVDSSTVVAYMSRLLDQPVRTFTIGFDEPGLDESGVAKRVARHLGTAHFEMTVRPEAFRLLPELVRHYGEPFADSSAIPTWYVSRLAAGQVKMVLSGDGGDEFFAGYSTYSSLLWAHRSPAGAWARVRHAVGDTLRGWGLKPALSRPVDTRYSWTCYFNEALRRALWRPEFEGLVLGTRGWFEEAYGIGAGGDLVADAQGFDVRHYLADDILTKVDVASMCHGLEVRVPFVDPPLFDLVRRLPTSLKVRPSKRDAVGGARGYVGKYLLKLNAERLLPGELVHRAKAGFAIPVDDWLRGPLAAEVRQRLLDPGQRLFELFRESSIRELMEAHQAGRDHGGRLWALLFLHEWLEQNAGWVRAH